MEQLLKVHEDDDAKAVKLECKGNACLTTELKANGDATAFKLECEGDASLTTELKVIDEEEQARHARVSPQAISAEAVMRGAIAIAWQRLATDVVAVGQPDLK